MTTQTSANDSAASADETQGDSWSDIVVRMASELAHPTFKRGDLADLRRLRPDSPDSPVVLRLMAHHDLLEGNGPGPALERKWALILHGMALMTPASDDNNKGNGSESGAPRPSAHNPTVPVGLALFQGGDPDRARAFYAESRLNRLLSARGPMFHTLLARTFRMLGADQPFNWRQMSRLIFQEGYDEEAADRIRYQIARSYYQAERRTAQAGEPSAE